MEHGLVCAEVRTDGPRLVVADLRVLRELVSVIEGMNRSRIYKGLLPLEHASAVVDPGHQAIALMAVARKQPPHPDQVHPAGSWITTTEAARRLGITSQAITKRARTGRIRAMKSGGCWWIDPREL